MWGYLDDESGKQENDHPGPLSNKLSSTAELDMSYLVINVIPKTASTYLRYVKMIENIYNINN